MFKTWQTIAVKVGFRISNLSQLKSLLFYPFLSYFLISQVSLGWFFRVGSKKVFTSYRANGAFFAQIKICQSFLLLPTFFLFSFSPLWNEKKVAFDIWTPRREKKNPLKSPIFLPIFVSISNPFNIGLYRQMAPKVKISVFSFIWERKKSFLKRDEKISTIIYPPMCPTLCKGVCVYF